MKIISVDFAVIFFCLLFECCGVSSMYSTDKQSAQQIRSHEQPSRGEWGGGGTSTDKRHLYKYTCGQYWSVPVVVVWKCVRK